MKYIWLGIKDYCKDCWHDWLLKHINRFPECQVYVASYKGDNTKEIHYVLWDRFWKEGSVWFYIKQRRIAKRKGNDTKHNRPKVG